MVRTAVMRVRSGNYRAAPYLNSFESYLFRCLARRRGAAHLVSLLIVTISAGNAFIMCLSAVLVFCCCRLLECAVIV